LSIHTFHIGKPRIKGGLSLVETFPQMQKNSVIITITVENTEEFAQRHKGTESTKEAE